MFFLVDTPYKVGVIHEAICFAYYCISSVQLQSEIQPLFLWIAVNTTFVQFT